MSAPGAGPLAEDLLSAHLDGCLDPEERAAVEARLATDRGWVAVLAELRTARDVLRALPAAEPPPGFWPEVIDAVRAAPDGSAARPRRVARRWPAAWLGTGWATAAAAAVVVALVLPGAGERAQERIVPTLGSMAAVHEQESGAGSVGTPGAPGADGATGWDAEVAAPFTGPAEAAGGFRLAGARAVGRDSVHLLYHDGDRSVSVFERRGALDWDALPAGGDRTALGARPAVRYGTVAGALLLWEHDGVVFTCVGDASPVELAALAADVTPETGEPWWRGLTDPVLAPFAW